MHNRIKSLLASLIVFTLVGGLCQSPVCAKTISLISSARSSDSVVAAQSSTLPMGMPAAKRWRSVTLAGAVGVSGGITTGDDFALDLFSDSSYKAKVDRVDTNSNGTLTIRGRIEGYPLGYTLISTTGNRSLIEIAVPEKSQTFFIQSDTTGSHYLIDVDRAALSELSDGPSPAASVEAPVMSSGSPTSTFSDSTTDQTLIDVMLVYTPAARLWADTYGGGIDNVIAQAISKGQLACDNSNTYVTLNLVHSAEVSYTESGNSGTDFDRLTCVDDGYVDSVHSLRDQYSADVVTLLAQVEDTGGLGWLLDTPEGYPSRAFNLCRVQQAGWSYTVVHEMGHNMGLHHAKSQNVQPGPGLFSYSAGWRWVGSNGNRYCSVMTYEPGSYFADGQTHTRVGYFSNPSLYHEGALTGDSIEGDNARTLREIRNVISAYRVGSIGSAIYLANGTRVSLAAKAVTGSFGDSFYIQETNAVETAKFGGIKVIWSTPPLTGVTATILGQISTRGVEKVIVADSVKATGVASVAPIGMSQRSLGGHIGNPVVLGFSDTVGRSAAYNLGVLVRSWGWVTYIDPGGAFGYINDGSSLNDGNSLGSAGNAVLGVRVTLPSGASMPAAGNFVTVTGVSSCDELNGNSIRVVRPRNQDDIRPAIAVGISGNIIQSSNQTTSRSVTIAD